MGVAAYQRGSALISRQICEEYGCPGCVRCREHVPTPRPADWGTKAQAKALDLARRVVSGAVKAGLPVPDVETLAAVVRERARVGHDTAHRAAEETLAHQPRTRPHG